MRLAQRMQSGSWKNDTPHFCAFVYTVFITGHFKISWKFDYQDRFKGIEGVRFYLHVHALNHTCDVLGNQFIIFYRCVRQTVHMVVDCFLKAILHHMDHLQFLLVTASMAITSVWISAPGVEAGVWYIWLAYPYLQAIVRLRRRWWWWASVLFVLVVQILWVLAGCLNFLSIFFMVQAPGFGVHVWSWASKCYLGPIRWWRNLFRHFCF